MKKNILLSSFAACALATSAYSQITVVEEAGTKTFDKTFTINAEAGNVLVVATYQDGEAYNNLTFGGAAATGSISSARVTLFYYNVQSSGNIEIATTTSPSNTASGLFVWELANVDTSIAPIEVSTTSESADITTTVDNMFIVDAIGANGGGTVKDVTITPDNPTMNVDFDYDINLTPGGFLGGGTGTAGVAGNYSLNWNLTLDSGSISDKGHLAYGFVPVPEPGTAALLLGLATLISVTIRRRHA